jgi:hypothetical protein
MEDYCSYYPLALDVMDDEKIGFPISKEDFETLIETLSRHIKYDLENKGMSQSFNSKKCDDCDRLLKRIAELEDKIKTFEDSIKNRRDCTSVWTKDGKVYYE